MDYSNGGDPWQWQGGDYCIQKDSNFDISECMWDGATQDEDFSYVLEKSTPGRACTGTSYHFGNYGETNKLSDGCRETSTQAKRRRVLQFDDDDLDFTFQSDDSSFLKSEEKFDALDEALSEVSQWETRIQEGLSSSGLECLDESESWLADCLNDCELLISSADLNSSGSTNVQIDVTEPCTPPSSIGANRVQQQSVRTSGNVIFKGTKSYMKTSAKLSSTVVCPFTFIKPSGANGDLTLKEINRQIQTPQSKSKEDNPATYGTSPFSGKPVVNKTKIRTKGGTGSITIMRTKG